MRCYYYKLQVLLRTERATALFFLENEVKTAFEAHDELVNFRRKLNTSFKDFLVEFQLKVNKVKQSGTKLSDGVLAYTLLQCANLSNEKVDMLCATCDNLDYKTVKKQLQKNYT